MKITIEGFYGHGNLGDEAILHALLGHLRGDGQTRTVVFTMRPDPVSVEHGIRAVHSRRRRSGLRRALELVTSNLFLLGGGGVLKDFGEDATSLAGWLVNLRMAQRLGRPTALGCVGAEHIRFRESRRLLRETLDRVDDLTVRDAVSLQTLKDVGIERDIHVAADPAVLLGQSAGFRSPLESGRIRVMVCVRHWFATGFVVENGDVFQLTMQTLAGVLDEVVSRWGAEVDFVPFRSVPIDDDTEIAAAVVSKMKHRAGVRVFDRVPRVGEFVQMVGRYDLLIGMRLHSLILAAVRGVPMVALSYAPKVAGFMSGIGQGAYCLDLGSATRENLLGSVERSIDGARDRSDTIAESIMRQRRTVLDTCERWSRLADTGRSRMR